MLVLQNFLIVNITGCQHGLRKLSECVGELELDGVADLLVGHVQVDVDGTVVDGSLIHLNAVDRVVDR